jgi:2-polyprenyl-3-methyl-5-hydroxy-6-metoxy-1,4-benzoquinol methylase
MKKQLGVDSVIESCPIDGGKFQKVIFSSNSFQLLQCSGCGLVATKVLMRDLGQGKEMYESREEAEKQFLTQGEKFRKYADEILDFLPVKKGKLLDVGCGLGWVVAQAKDRGFDAMGIDESKVYVGVGEKHLGVDLFPYSLETMYSKRQKKFRNYDVVILKHVLEHVENPKKFLEIIKEFLVPGGKLLVACPNINSLMFRLFSERWYGLVPNQHLWQFSAKTLARLLESNGFNIKRIEITNLDYQVKGIKGIIFSILLKIADIFKLGDQVVVLATLQ